MKLRGAQGGIASKPTRSPLRSDGSRDIQVGRLDRMNSSQKILKAKLNLKVEYQA
jgi:hypothetical protein